jgi:hypothetical protein
LTTVLRRPSRSRKSAEAVALAEEAQHRLACARTREQAPGLRADGFGGQELVTRGGGQLVVGDALQEHGCQPLCYLRTRVMQPSERREIGLAQLHTVEEHRGLQDTGHGVLAADPWIAERGDASLAT